MRSRHSVRLLTLAVCLPSLLALARTAGAVTPSNPYQGIVDRNVFGLKPPPPPPPDTGPPKPPPPNITLTGITTILGNKRVFLSVAMPPKPPDPAKIQSFMMTEGQRDGEIEVLQIDEIAGTVKVNDFGTITNLTWDKNGMKTPGGSPGAAPVAGGIPAPPPNPFISNPAYGQKAIPQLPQRTVRLPGSADNNQPGANGQQGNALQNGLGQPGVNNSAVPGGLSEDQQIAAQRTVEESALLYEANRLKNEELIKAGAKIPRMPPHAFLGDQQQAGAPAQTPVMQTPFNPFNNQRPQLPQ